MSDAARPVRVADLLAHREWVSRVARALVRDADAAADLEQDLWVEMLDRPPVVRRSIRGWLATALRRDMLGMRRGAVRRVRRETAAARPEAQPSTEEIVARAEAADRVTHAVLELDEPYRSTILLRYVEDLGLAQIAAQGGVPIESVRTRHKRGLALLRARLGASGGGDAWLAAIAPIVDVRWNAGAAGASGATTVAFAGGTIMGAKTIAAVGVGLALAAGVAGGRLSAATDERPEARVAELVQRVEALDVARATKASPRSTPEDERRAARDRRLDAIEADLDAALATHAKRAGDVELDRLTALATSELLVEAKRLVKVARYTKATADADAAMQACGLLLARALEAEQRAETLVLKGHVHAVLDERAAEEASLREALGAAETGSFQWRNAMKSLGYMASRHGDPSAAAEWFFTLGRQEAKPGGRAYYRYSAASFLACPGASPQEKNRARDEYRAVVDEFGASDDKDVRKWVDMARAALAGMDGDVEKPTKNAPPPPGRTDRAR